MQAKHLTINGVDVDQLRETLGNISNDPGLARAKFRATNRWMNGGHSTTTIHDFYSARQDLVHEHDFKLEADEPPLLLGQDKGANSYNFV